VPSFDGGLVIAVGAIMPYARESSKHGCDVYRACGFVFRKAEMVNTGERPNIVIANAAKQ
jgi:hypothetical protein